jgi:hypothetical protein
MSEVNVAEEVEKVLLPFDADGTEDASRAVITDGALALSSAEATAAKAAEEVVRLANYAHSWGITIPAGFSPATKAQVAYWRELCGAISLTGADGMQDSDWPTDLAP